MISAAKTSDLILLVLDATKGDVQKQLLLDELYMCGIRINKKPPNCVVTLKGEQMKKNCYFTFIYIYF